MGRWTLQAVGWILPLLLVVTHPDVAVAEVPFFHGLTTPVEVGSVVSLRTVDRVGHFAIYEGYADYRLPGRWRLGGTWAATLRGSLSAGGITGDGRSGVMVAGGPHVRLQGPKAWFYLDVGTRLTLISRHTFQHLNLGYPLQFISHAELGVPVGHHLHLAVRIQHISNARVALPNPGANILATRVGYQF